MSFLFMWNGSLLLFLKELSKYFKNVFVFISNIVNISYYNLYE